MLTPPPLLTVVLLSWALVAQPVNDSRPAACSESDFGRFSAMDLAGKSRAFDDLGRGNTSRREERQMECLVLTIDSGDLSQFKFGLEYDGDYKDIVEYLFHDIDCQDPRAAIVAHLRTSPRTSRVKVLTDVDDTMFTSLIDARYTPGVKALYPGVVEFYDALKEEPFPTTRIPVTTLSARPNPLGGVAEESSLSDVVAKTGRRVNPSALSGELGSALIGTIETLARAHRANRRLTGLFDRIPHEQEDKIGEVKFANCQLYSIVFPEYRYVFVGDSGQADALTAQLLTRGALAEGASRPIVTFIHDLKRSETDIAAASPAFRRLTAMDLAGAAPTRAPGVIVFRNYIQAALMAYEHRDALGNLITAEELARITTAALAAFEAAAPAGPFRQTLDSQYLADAERVAGLLAGAVPAPVAAGGVSRALDRPFWRAVSARAVADVRR